MYESHSLVFDCETHTYTINHKQPVLFSKQPLEVLSQQSILPAVFSQLPFTIFQMSLFYRSDGRPVRLRCLLAST